ncbi:MAG: nucleotidyltransferase domain-containing protein [Leptospiraceae bacterium]|nr:nucleotidyltransferase domain-containing protein [Leptospiraceae bacterium]
MLEFKINDPEIENVYHSSDEIINLLKAIVNKEVSIVPNEKSEVINKTKLIEMLKEYFKNKPIQKAYLFGSYARGEANGKSDIDILVELDYSTKIGTQFFRMTDDLQELFGKKVDLLSSEAVTEKIKDQVWKERVLVYER